MEKIDKRHVYGIMVDTETANMFGDPFFYDCGWQIVDSHGRKYGERSFLNTDILFGERDLMKTAYYANKVIDYWAEVQQGKRELSTTAEIHKTFLNDLREFDCKFVCAHNSSFDVRTLNGTQRWVTKSAERFFLPDNIEIWDTQKMAHDVICTMPTYRKFCEENGYMTNHKTPRPRETAEILYRFISGNDDFIECHTGLEDVDIERQILAYCVRQHKPMRKG